MHLLGFTHKSTRRTGRGGKGKVTLREPLKLPDLERYHRNGASATVRVIDTLHKRWNVLTGGMS